MSFADHVRDTFTGGCRFGMPVAVIGFGQDVDGAAVPVSRPLRTEVEAREDRARCRFAEHALALTRGFAP